MKDLDAFDEALKNWKPHRLMGVFGMFEMEKAAEKILEKAEKNQSWDIEVSLSEMGDDVSAENGFLHLLSYGWLRPTAFSKSHFRISQSFIDRLLEKKVAKNLGSNTLGL